MRFRHASVLLVLVIATLLAVVIAGPASATPSKDRVCTDCHSGAASGIVTAAPSTSTPAAGTAYTVAISIGLASSGNTGYHIARTDAAGTALTWVAINGGPGSQTSWTANMTAPVAAGTYYYKVWCAKGPASSSGQAKAATYSITVPAPPAANAALTGLSPASGPVGTTFTISGTGLGASGAVSVGGISAATTAWSATSINCTVPAGLTAGSKNVVVTPSGGAASNALPFTVAVGPAPAPAAAITSLTPDHAQTGASVVIAGANLGAGGAVRFGDVTATTSAWSATSVTATVPAGLAAGATSVTVMPSGAAASNALGFTVDAPAAADSTAPTTAAVGPAPGVWCNNVVTITLAATDDGGSGVATIVYRVDGGPPVVVKASTVDVPVGVPPVGAGGPGVRAVDGPHTVDYYAMDNAGNVAAMQTLTLNIDTCKPATRAPRAAKVKRGRVAALKYEVRDDTPNAGTAKVVITIKNRRGKVVKRLQPGSKPVNTALTAKFRCSLRPGIYRFSVSATDAAGNTQSTIASQTLTVR